MFDNFACTFNKMYFIGFNNCNVIKPYILFNGLRYVKPFKAFPVYMLQIKHVWHASHHLAILCLYTHPNFQRPHFQFDTVCLIDHVKL